MFSGDAGTRLNEGVHCLRSRIEGCCILFMSGRERRAEKQTLKPLLSGRGRTPPRQTQGTVLVSYNRALERMARVLYGLGAEGV